MDNQAQFTSALAALVDFAAANDNKLTKEEISNCLKDIIKDETAYGSVYDYLASQKIQIENYNSSPDNINEYQSVSDPDLSDIKISEEAEMFLDMYKKDLESIIPLGDGEKDKLIAELILGSEAAKERLIEAHLNMVIDIVSEYTDREVPANDLIQEGNIGLIHAITTYSDSLNFDDYIRQSIKAAIETALDEQINAGRIGVHLAERANQLDKISTELCEKLGREPNISELAERMHITEDETERILKFSLNALTVDGAGDGTI